jgi:hypothetical protein
VYSSPVPLVIEVFVFICPLAAVSYIFVKRERKRNSFPWLKPGVICVIEYDEGITAIPMS